MVCDAICPFLSNLSFWDLPKIIKNPCRQDLFILKLHYWRCPSYVSDDFVTSLSFLPLSHHKSAPEEASEHRSCCWWQDAVQWWVGGWLLEGKCWPPFLLSSRACTCKEQCPQRNTLASAPNTLPTRLKSSSLVKPPTVLSSPPSAPLTHLVLNILSCDSAFLSF